MTDGDERLRRIWRAAPAGGEHVDEAAWERLATGELAPAERARVIDHVVTCPECAAAYRVVTALADEARAIDPSLPAPRLPGATRRSAWWATGALLAAAAAVAIFVALPRERAPTVRGEPAATVELVAPPGASQVAWRPVAGAESYRVRIFTEDGREHLSSTATGTEARWPTPPPGKYSVVVEALRGGRVIASSTLRDFSVGR